MRIVADENVPRQIVEGLRTAGHLVEAIAELSPRADDDEVLARSARSQALLLTQEKDFGELVYRTGRSSHGVLLLRLEGLSPARKTQLVLSVFEEFGSELVGAFAVLTPRQLRIRSPQGGR
jgi:predicted nuclease of predicted toxin-antitoxin system